MKAFKRNAVIVAVLLFVCAAVYLNWSYNNGEAAVLSPDAETEGQNANADVGTPTDEAGLYYESEETASETNEYFAEARLTRQQARDEATATLQLITDTEGASKETIDKALAGITKIADWSVKEAELESLITAKGFSECVVFISDDGINVTVPVPQEGLSSASVAKITDIITEKTEFTAADLKIIEIK